jgi:hypothetical protein
MNSLFKTVSLAFAISISMNIAAEVKITYKWTDAKGEVHYSERAPKGIDFKTIRTYLNANQQSPPVPSFKSTQNKIESKKDSYGTWRDENCTLANQNLDILTQATRIGVDDGQGGKRLMTDEEKKSKITKMEEQRDKYCQAADKK